MSLRSTLWSYICNGPRNPKSVPEFLLSSCLWWRTWAVGIVLLTSIVVLYSGLLGRTDQRLWGYMIGGITVMILNSIDNRAYDSN